MCGLPGCGAVMLPVCPCGHVGAVLARGGSKRLSIACWPVCWRSGRGSCAGAFSGAERRCRLLVGVRESCRELAFLLFRAAEALSGNRLAWDGKEKVYGSIP